MKWECLSAHEMNRIPRDTVVVLPVGSIEQHGAHLPLGTDSMIVEGIVEAVDQAFGGSLLILPVQRIGCSDHHMGFPGTLTLRHETLLSAVLETLSAVVRHGFRRILVLNSHGGNQAIGEVIAQQAAGLCPDTEVVFATWWRVCADELRGIADGEFREVCHACEFETSLMLALHPRLVDMTLARDGGEPRGNVPRPERLRARWGAVLPAAFERLSAHGVYGRPTLASEHKGRRILDAAVKALCELIDSCWPRAAGSDSAGQPA